MLFQPLRLGLIVEYSRLNPVIISRLHVPKIFLKIRDIRDIRKLAELNRIIDIEGIYLRLSRLLKTRLIREITEIGEFKILLELDKRDRTSAVKEFVSSITYVHEVIPVVDIYRGLENIYVANISTISSLVIDLSKTPKEHNLKVIRNVSYLRDCLNSILRSRNMTIGVIISRTSMELFELLREILTLSSYIYVKDSVEDVLLLQNIFEKTRSTSQIIQAIAQLLCSGEVKVEVNIE
ncbi:MAG: hypothetical protein GXO23_06455 [Crenarchaeota archaeon]|nr:hypothetical protein [Thermoproteota archaeon]